MAKKKTSAMIAQPGAPADGYTIKIDYEPESESFAAHAIFNNGTIIDLIDKTHNLVVDSIIEGSFSSLESDAETVRRYAFYAISSATEYVLNEVKTIDTYAFAATSAKIYMPKIQTLNNNCFQNYGREKFYLPSSVNSVSTGAFGGSNTAITDIYCDFAKGAVAGAPWGASKATVHYDVPYPASIDEME